MSNIIAEIEKSQIRSDIPKFNIGDTVRVHFRIVEGEKERIQVFEGVVIARKNAESASGNFTVRRISYNEGVERVFPLHSPRVAKVEVVREGKVRRAKLHYLRERSGKAARVRQKGFGGVPVVPGETMVVEEQVAPEVEAPVADAATETAEETETKE